MNRFMSNVSTCITLPSSEGGANEHDCTLLPSGDVMCVMRTASGWARGEGGAPFYMTTSGDGGRSKKKINLLTQNVLSLGDTDGVLPDLTPGDRSTPSVSSRGS